MSGLFQAIELGKRALLTHQLTMQTIGHNIANVNTPGYTRQRTTITTTFPTNDANYSIGTGVTASDVRHIRDLFLGEQYRQENKALGQWSYKEKTLSQIEALFAEPGDTTLSDRLNKFWQAWANVANHPDDSSVRAEILSQANLLVNGLHEMSEQLTSLQDAVDRDLVNITQEVNRLTDEIARINAKIKINEVGGVHANDLRDTRDLLIDELSTYVDVNSRETGNGIMTVYMGALAIVDGDTAHHIEATTFNVDGVLKRELTWEGTEITLRNNNGQLKGLIDSRDVVIPNYLDKLDQLAAAIVENVNSIHRTGTNGNGETSVNFFDSRFTTAATIRINQSVVDDNSRIMSGTSGEAGDNRVALAISDLLNVRVMSDGTASINDFYNRMVGSLGVETYEAISSTSNYEVLTEQIVNARQSVEGVSLDEEMANLVKYQHAYDAAARIITAMDEALDTVVTGMGIVGR